MVEHSILSEEELDFIRKLMQPNGSKVVERTAGFRIDGGAQGNALLLQLAAQADLRLQAEFEHFSMSFPVRLLEDELHSLDLQLAAPLIYERGPVLRAWRLQLPEPFALLESNGTPSPFSVLQLSAHGVLVAAGKRRKPPRQFHLGLAMPDGAILDIDAQRVRELQEGVAAYRISFVRQEDAERVRAFLYEQHQRLHPELRPELPDDLV